MLHVGSALDRIAMVGLRHGKGSAVELQRGTFQEVGVMLQPRCAICGQPATIHETALEGGAAVTRHLCQEHGVSVLPAVDLGPQAAQTAAEQYRNLSDAEKEHFALLYRLTHRSS
jgi:hypothetical protein